MTKRPEKKSETIEVRLSYTEKRAFKEACADAGITASQAVRTYIDEVLHPRKTSLIKRLANYSALIFAVLGFGFAGYAISRNAEPPTMGERMVRFYDRDGDDAISSLDIAVDIGDNAVDREQKASIAWLLLNADENQDGKVSAYELDARVDTQIEIRESDTNAGTTGEEHVLILPSFDEGAMQDFLEGRSTLGSRLSPEQRDRIKIMIQALQADARQNASAKDEKPANQDR